MIWRALQFDNPQTGWLFLFVVIMGWLFFLLYRYRQKKLETLAEPTVLNAVMEKREPLSYWIKVFLFCIAWVCGVLSLMGPKGNERYISTAGTLTALEKNPEKKRWRRNTHEVILLLDASASMKISDVSGRTRLDMAKEIADAVIGDLKGENVSLFAFTSATIQIVPSTLDYLFTRLMLRNIAINEGETEGTDIKQALEYVRKLYFEENSSKAKTLIIFSDGGDTHLDGSKETISQIVSPIQDAAERNLRVFAVGLGSTQGANVPNVSFQSHPVHSSLEIPLLRKLASVGQGELFIVGEQTSFAISQALSLRIAQNETFVDAEVSNPDSGNQMHVYDDYFQYPLGIAILALIGYLLIPDTRKKISERNL